MASSIFPLLIRPTAVLLAVTKLVLLWPPPRCGPTLPKLALAIVFAVILESDGVSPGDVPTGWDDCNGAWPKSKGAPISTMPRTITESPIIRPAFSSFTLFFLLHQIKGKLQLIIMAFAIDQILFRRHHILRLYAA